LYGTCLFCNASLGANEVVETFPVGRRLAFDARLGRLWVVCRRCERWNLSPLEERWEAVEDLERMFRETRIRASTEHVGLARHREGLELVRIGEPLRPEFAAWRYGDQFGRRRRRAILYGAGGLGVFAVIVLGGAAAGVIGGGLLAQSGNLANLWVNGRTRLKLRTDAGEVLRLKNPDLLGTRIRPADDDVGFAVELRKRKTKHWFEGEEARRIAGLVLPKMNASGGKQDTVLDAVGQIDLHRHPDAFLRTIAQGNVFTDKKGVPGYVNKMPKATKLAVEMALHEESERRALEDELWRLEQAWKSAEEIASIADDLLVTDDTRRRLAGHRDLDE
jgi:hypothetical protein